MDMLKFEFKHWDNGKKYIAGVDEAGRGPLAGPVVSAAVIFRKDFIINDINDSKKISPIKRQNLFYEIIENCLAYGIGVVHEDVIDQINILEATYLSMKKAIGSLKTIPDQILVDGPRSNIKQFPVEHIINGDQLSHSIAAASILAKVYRDKIMLEYEKLFPAYYFKNNKGYGTKKHIESIHENKATPIHRKSFKIVKENMPNYEFILKNKGFPNLAVQLVGSKYVKDNYIILYKDIFINDDSKIDLCLKKNNKILFIKIKTIVEDKSSKIYEKSHYKNFITNYLAEKDIKFKNSFIVISVLFKNRNKPIIKINDI